MSRFYLIADAADIAKLTPAQLTAKFEAARQRFDIACLQLRPSAPRETETAIALLQPLLATHEIEFLLADEIDLATRAQLDGVHLNIVSTHGLIAKLRKKTGDAFTIGVSVALRRDEAMQAAEDGADYILIALAGDPNALDDSLDFIAWWAEIMTVPLVVEVGYDLAHLQRVETAGADFIALASALWSNNQLNLT